MGSSMPGVIAETIVQQRAAEQLVNTPVPMIAVGLFEVPRVIADTLVELRAAEH